MADTAPARVNEGSDELEQASDLDSEDGDAVIARGWPRDHHNLAKKGFRPIWTTRDGYPEKEIPADIREWLDENEERKTAQIIDPLRSLAWLAGLDDLVEAIDHSAWTIQDDIEIVPQGAGITFPVNRYMEEGKIPPRIWDRIAFTPSSRKSLGSAFIQQHKIPTGVNEILATHNLQDLYATSRIRPFTGTIKCVKLPFDKNVTRLATNVRRLNGSTLASDRDGLWFRGIGLDALESTLTFFIPERNSRNVDNEFGPGFYTTDNLEHALEYTRGGGAVMVFKDPDTFTTQLWQPNLQDWNSFVCRWFRLSLTIADQPVPSPYLTADFIKGPISADRDTGGRRPPMQGDDKQLVAVSYKGCEALSHSLHSIIFVERR